MGAILLDDLMGEIVGLLAQEGPCTSARIRYDLKIEDFGFMVLALMQLCQKGAIKAVKRDIKLGHLETMYEAAIQQASMF